MTSRQNDCVELAYATITSAVFIVQLLQLHIQQLKSLSAAPALVKQNVTGQKSIQLHRRTLPARH